jgi:GNAT superfamily N-acetyltransferase
MEDLADIAIASERVLHQSAQPLPDDDNNVGKALLARSAVQPFLMKPMRLSLRPLHDEGAWEQYERLRLPVETSFGLTPEQGCAAVEATRIRVERQGFSMWLAVDERHQILGAMGAFRVPAHPDITRLQEVDVFPRHRGHGLGNDLLESIRLVLVERGVTVLLIGADEDDWPLSWCQRRGFQRVARVPVRRESSLGLPWVSPASGNLPSVLEVRRTARSRSAVTLPGEAPVAAALQPIAVGCYVRFAGQYCEPQDLDPKALP